MARWRLITPHYLRVPGTEWEYKEASHTGKQVRKVFQVPLYLNPRDPADCNYPDEIIVAHANGKEQVKDIIFEGDPTPDMTPLDDEAKAISAEWEKQWKHPIEDVDTEGGYARRVENTIMEDLRALRAQAQPSTPVGPSQEAFDMLKGQVSELMKMNTTLMQQLGARRV